MTITYTEEQVSKMKPVKNVKTIKRRTFYPFHRMNMPAEIMEIKEVDLDGIR